MTDVIHAIKANQKVTTYNNLISSATGIYENRQKCRRVMQSDDIFYLVF